MFTPFSCISADGGDCVVSSVEPLLDKYGHVSRNADGSFYPCDRFEIVYSVDLSGEFVFETAELTYDSSVFSMFDSNNLGSMVGSGLFEVLPSASAGTYHFYVTVWGYISEPESEPDWEPKSFVVAETGVSIEVVMYDPHFTVTLAYTMPSGSGSSYDKPFTFIVRYDGNGPDFNLNQRAIIDDYTWEGYAQKLPETSNMQQALTPNLTVASFLNQTSNTHFLAQGIEDAKNSQMVLNVDGKSFVNSELPQVFLWETNTNHTYIWTQTLPVDGAGFEWFEWQASITFPPAINPNLDNQVLSQENLQNQLLDQINSPNGTLTTTPFGNTVTAMYAHNKNIEQIAKDTGVGKDQTLKNLNPTPTYFTLQERYTKLQYQLDPKVAKEIAVQNFTNSLYYNLTIGCDLFGVPRYFEANFTCEYEFFDKPINATAYKWNPTLQNWTIDNTVTIDATFESALNITTTDILRSNLEEQTSDQTALKMALADLYTSGPQTFTGTGSIEANLKRTSPLYYNLKITAGQQQKVTLQKTVQLNFQNNNTYNLPLNFDPNSPLQVTVLSDSSQNTILQLDAPTELGGLTNITIYLITNPNENWNNLPKNQLDLRLLKTLELTIPQEQVQMPPEHEQFYQYYSGYSAIFEDILGFQGQTQIAIQKDKTTTALTKQGEALLYVEATNVWGTTFHQIIPIQPYSAPKWNIPLNQATTYLVVIVIVAILVSFVTYLVKAKQ
ncbi:MAG: hypothetical protein LBI79_03215 [Nitrososphaerota archaeon]|jgi:hypothetical protein|nr:hypothetical protein [Nitrososphaerota archaeon]